MSRPKLLLGLLAGALVVSFVGGGLLRQYQHDQVALARERELKRFGGLFQQAKYHFRAYRWSEARATLLRLQAEAPDHPGLRDYLAHVEQESSNHEHLKAARAALTEQQLGKAQAELDQISTDTMISAQVIELKRALKDVADQRVREASALFDTLQLDPASALVTEVLAAFPDHRDAQVLASKLQVQKTLMDPLRTPGDPSVEWTQAARVFGAGDPEGATKRAQACAPRVPQCKSGLKALQEFNRLFQKAGALDGNGLLRLLTLDKQITGMSVPSALCQEMAPRAASLLYKSATAAQSKGQWQRAAQDARRALDADSSYVRAGLLLNELRNQARDRYLKAYAIKDTDPRQALWEFRRVTALTLPEDEVHQKAQAWIERLTR